MAYVYQPYPRWKYHATLPAVIVQNEEEEKALGAEWGDAPVEAPQEKRKGKAKA